EGIVEDVTDIILNLKQVRFIKLHDSLDGKVTVEVRNQEVFTAGDIGKFASAFEILNRDLVICHLDESRSFEIQLTIEKGQGYQRAEDSKPKDQVFGVIPIDAIFTPIKNVKYRVENTRVKQKTDFEQLVLEVSTDGSIHPEKALQESAKILIQHFMLFSDHTMVIDAPGSGTIEPIDEEFLHRSEERR